MRFGLLAPVRLEALSGILPRIGDSIRNRTVREPLRLLHPSGSPSGQDFHSFHRPPKKEKRSKKERKWLLLLSIQFPLAPIGGITIRAFFLDTTMGDMSALQGSVRHIRSASIRVTREARRAGSAPPRIPTKVANNIPCMRIFGVMRKLKSTSLKFVKLAVPVEMPCNGSARIHPTSPPRSASNVDSSMKDDKMLQRENPSARRVPTSLVRERTVAYIIFMAAKQEPMPMTSAMKVPSALIPTEETAWLLKYSFCEMA